MDTIVDNESASDIENHSEEDDDDVPHANQINERKNVVEVTNCRRISIRSCV